MFFIWSLEAKKVGLAHLFIRSINFRIARKPLKIENISGAQVMLSPFFIGHCLFVLL